MRKLGRLTKPAMTWIESTTQAIERLPEQRDIQFTLLGFKPAHVAQMAGDLSGGLLHVGAARAPDLGNLQEQTLEAGPAVAIIGRKIRAAGERLQVRRQKH